MTARTQEQILAHYREVKAGHDDFFGFRREVLLGAMTRDTAQTALDVDMSAEEWVQADVEADAREYLTFAIDKAVGHRGISASRSVDKLGTYAWLLGRDDVVKAMDAAEYGQYGVPKLKAFAEGMGWPWPGDVDEDDAAALARMAKGEHCDPEGCVAGCGL